MSDEIIINIFDDLIQSVNGQTGNVILDISGATVFSSVSSIYDNTTTTVASNSANWNFGYNVATTYQTTSSSFATNTLLQSTSALLTPLALTNTLTSQLVLNTDFDSYNTNVASATATLLPITVYQSASGSFVRSSAINNIIPLTQAEYDAISIKDEATLYLITDP